jgi:cobalt/nickel transport system permease protein
MAAANTTNRSGRLQGYPSGGGGFPKAAPGWTRALERTACRGDLSPVAHIPDGFLSVPVLTGTAGASAAALATAARRSAAALGEREGPVLGAVTAFVFAAQMLNFPLGIGASAHLLGGALVAVLLGPWAGMLVLFAVLIVQALLFQDGGIAALGANTFNLAVLGVGSAYLVYHGGRRLAGDTAAATIGSAAVAAWVSTVLVGLAVAAELVLSGLVPWRAALLLVGGGHVLVGIAEAALTGLLVSFVLRTRPALIAARPRPAAGVPTVAVAGAAVAVVAAAVVFASRQADVVESVLERVRAVKGPSGGGAVPLADYAPPMGGAWVAGALGLLAAFLVAWGLALAVGRRRP